MLLGSNFISNTTKKLFRQTLECLKRFFSHKYHKLPKSPSCNPCNSCIGSNGSRTRYASRDDLDRFYDEFINRQEHSEHKKNKKRGNDTANMMEDKALSLLPRSNATSQPMKQEQDKKTPSSMENPTQRRDGQDCHFQQAKSATREEDQEQEQDQESCLKGGERDQGKTAKALSVKEKLRELGKMDMSNVDHVLDIEEVMHYYSRLNCPAYVGIVDKFFMEIFSEFFGGPSTSRSSLI